MGGWGTSPQERRHSHTVVDSLPLPVCTQKRHNHPDHFHPVHPRKFPVTNLTGEEYSHRHKAFCAEEQPTEGLLPPAFGGTASLSTSRRRRDDLIHDLSAVTHVRNSPGSSRARVQDANGR